MTSSELPLRRLVLSGPPGAGKTALLTALKPHFRCVDEPARRVIALQRASGGRDTGDSDPAKFVDLMLDMALRDYNNPPRRTAVVIYDRGLPDLLAYATYFGLDAEPL